MPNPHYLSDLIETLKKKSSSLIMNWGEDTGQWEVSIITGGERYTAVRSVLSLALEEIEKRLWLLEAKDRLIERSSGDA